MNVDEKIVARLADLVERGEDIAKTKRNPPPNYIGFDATVDSVTGNQWRASASSILAKTLGRNSEHFLLFDSCFKKGVTFSPLLRGIGILKAAKEDYEHGFIQDVRNLVTAEVFTNLLDQALELMDAGYYGPAAVLAGAVFEDELRKLCEINEVMLPERPKLDYMNAQLAKAGAYNKVTQKRITAIADVRNSAAHGNWDKFSKADVEDMVRWIVDFTERNLG